jgi:cellulose synthase (UDP-forming)
MNHDREIFVTRVLLGLTATATVLAFVEIGGIGVGLAAAGDWHGVAIQGAFAVVVAALTYGFFAYAFTRVAQLQRRRDHRPVAAGDLEAMFDGDAPPLAVLVPSYREEAAVVRRTLLSAALQDYPNRRIVLLIDDPHRPQNGADEAGLCAMRALPGALQRLFDAPAGRYAQSLHEFADRCAASAFDGETEASRLARLHHEAAAWFDVQIAAYPIADHGDALFASAVLARCRDAHRARAARFEGPAAAAGLDAATALHEHRRLAALFRVEFSSFERRRYDNLSHAANKAMNLNSYLALMGRSHEEVRAGAGGGIVLREVPRGRGTFDVADATFVLTLDADSVILPDYASRLAHLMNRPGNERLAVAQTPYSAFPGAPGVLERIAGATTDIQYLIHQGFTRFDATFWVGANALLRKAALEDIRTTHTERGHPVVKYIQDRTVIEDTESSVDLVARGWTLVNYPERLAYSATPPDFGALLIQRRRWANGGLIILPKALRYLGTGPLGWRKVAEGFFRVHYLASLAVVNVALLMLLFGPFDRNLRNLWLVACSIPYMVLYARDLVLTGYRGSDFLRVYALNLLLVPVHLAGVLQSLRQAVTGKRTPFARTPKVSGRTAAPGIYVVVECGLFAAAAAMAGAAVLDANWLSASFALAYAAFAGYAIVAFVGLPACVEDLRVWLNPRASAPGASAAPVLQLTGLPEVDANTIPDLRHLRPGLHHGRIPARQSAPQTGDGARRPAAAPARDDRAGRPARRRGTDGRGYH